MTFRQRIIANCLWQSQGRQDFLINQFFNDDFAFKATKASDDTPGIVS